VLIQSPEGAQLLVDGGNLPVRLLTQMGDHLPFGDDTLDVVVATQPDAENTGALMDVLSRYQTGVLVTNGQQNLDETWLNLMALAERTHPMQAGASVQLGDGVQVEVLWPKSPPTLAERLNDATLVLRVTYGEVSVLLAGDLSQTVQDSLAEDVPLASTVLHVTQPWRSDAVTADFWRAVQPSLTIISERADSQRDNPDPALLQMLSERPVLNTAGGTIHLWTDGITLWSEQIPT
jgi:beta-lactamase superfamily II metal-dependent hydrolase